MWYFARYASLTASSSRSPVGNRARTRTVRPRTWIAPTGSSRNVRYQLRGLRLHDRTKTRPSTTTAQMPMKRCGSVPARIASIFSSSMADTIVFGSLEAGRGTSVREVSAA